MPDNLLIADCGSSKSEWALLHNGKVKKMLAQGISPYFLDTEQITGILKKEVQSKIKKIPVDEIYYYGTGCANATNVRSVKKAMKNVFPDAKTKVSHDLLAAAHAVCGREKGIACILGTGSNSCYYNGRGIVKNSPGLGFILGDEGSGAYLGKKVVQHYLYDIFDDELRSRFDLRYLTTPAEILENVYKKPLPNRYLANFARFLAENRNHYMIENIIEDGLNDFFFNHLCRYKEINKQPVHFVGSIAFVFQDVVQLLCRNYDFQLGTIMQNPMDGLITYYS